MLEESATPHQSIPTIAAIFLAAGQSRRFGKANKLLSEIEGRPLIERSLTPLLNGDLDEIIIVTGHESQAIKAAIPPHIHELPNIRIIENKAYSQGMGSSLAAGISALSNTIDACYICLADMPDIPPESFKHLREALYSTSSIRSGEAARENIPTIIAPTHKGQRGHPVLFASCHFPALKALSGDRGAKEIIEKNNSGLKLVELNTTAILRDIDCMSDLKQ